MRNIFKPIFLLASVVAGFASCKKEGDQYTLKPGIFTTNGLTATPTTIVLTNANDNNTVVTFNWPAVDFGKDAISSYILQVDKTTDTSGAQGWANAKTFTVGNNITTYAFIGKDLNNLLNSMGFSAGAVNNVAVRIKSDVNQYNGAASTVPSVYSNVLTLKITPYAMNLFVPGDYQNWDPASAPVISPVTGRAGLFEGYVNMQGAGLHYFKYTNAPDWNHTNYGDGGGGTFSTDGAAAGLSVPDGGYYELTANLNNNTWTATKTTWSILGDASPGGWNTDTQLTYDATNQVWTVTCNMIKNGSFKFRANNAWNIDFGVDAAGNLAYADNPFFGYNASINNISVPADGNYTITLDLHVSGKYTYNLKKN